MKKTFGYIKNGVYPRVSGSQELDLHQGSNMPIKWSPDWRQDSLISHYKELYSYKYTNPARGILDFLQAKVLSALPMSPQNIYKLKWWHCNFDKLLLFWKYCAMYGVIAQYWPIQNKFWQYCAMSECVAQCPGVLRNVQGQGWPLWNNVKVKYLPGNNWLRNQPSAESYGTERKKEEKEHRGLIL